MQALVGRQLAGSDGAGAVALGENLEEQDCIKTCRSALLCRVDAMLEAEGGP